MEEENSETDFETAFVTIEIDANSSVNHYVIEQSENSHSSLKNELQIEEAKEGDSFSETDSYNQIENPTTESYSSDIERQFRSCNGIKGFFSSFTK